MKKVKGTAPACPKCKSENTIDVITKPGSNMFFLLVPEDGYGRKTEEINGNSKYYCQDCFHYWKKYRGKKPYRDIKRLIVSSGGFFGKSFDVNLDLEMLVATSVESEQATIDFQPIERQNKITEEMLEMLLEELYKCDFLNWAEEYIQHYVMDGSHWQVHIEYTYHCEIKKGTNNFPPKWTKFCKTIGKLSNTDFY